MKTGNEIQIKAAISKAGKSYQRKIRVTPVKHDYGDGDHYDKYSCPIIELLGVKFQLTLVADNCFCCGVNLCWDEEEF